MSMIGGEAAEMTALGRRNVREEDLPPDGRDPYGLGWVMDWLYGDAVLPPSPLPRDVEEALRPVRPRRAPVHAGAAAAGPVRVAPPRRRRERQLVLL